ncbi:MAG: acetyl-CoA carboxylase, carboxyltransferase subunit beta [Ignavibacteriae bacterium]|jgi:acetyl-CoA carboxylase carboxyl transferase subunit beta|nr:acetyl-CoA carboxylase, carboxyltransferase subunit beta [Ignavibacteriota bacterium]
MSWFLRSKKNIEQTEQRDMPDGLFVKCPSCNDMIYRKQFEEQFYTCNKCDHHFRITVKEYVDILFDEGSFTETDINVTSTDPLKFVDTKPYVDRLRDAKKRSELHDALTIGYGNIHGRRISFACMNFGFVGGSMGSVVGEKFYRAAKRAIKERMPFIVISTSGGARMQEAALSLMQMAKTSAVLSELAEHKLPFISVITDPTTGGVSASYAMLGDLIIAEPKALIGFAGPRVVEQTIRKKLPEGFQRSEFLLEHGFLDMIVHRKEMRETLHSVLSMLLDK